MTVPDDTPSPSFPPKPGEVTARFTMEIDTVRTRVAPVMEKVPMFIYSPADRCGVFYLARLEATRVPFEGDHSIRYCEELRRYSFVATCMGPMSEAASFSYDPLEGTFTVFYGSERGVGPPGR